MEPYQPDSKKPAYKASSLISTMAKCIPVALPVLEWGNCHQFPLSSQFCARYACPNPALSSSFCEHSRKEGPAANTCDACKASFQTNSDLESHAKSLSHSAFRCKCGTPFSRYSSLARHINSKTGIGYHCGLCEDKTFGRIDKLYDHLRDGHKVSKKVLDRCKNKELGRDKKPVYRPIKSSLAPVVTPQATPASGFWPAWSPTEQMNGATGRHAADMPPSSPSGFNPVNFTVRPRQQKHGIKTGLT
ncbi:hypothetical protein J7T55_009897 [Diaporthe amygdali]|uniref:uncharacterized protein n=1 Tax=Phomopsis amygdali TaxID=1214568 RepID=UPI0022FF4566|nr:uncharacterized protein J7T55_009897 [Diaporthe amygdali]KAJ0116747.1 hypothetical protein J7T55_009897 [Diaporthe amygdali]